MADGGPEYRGPVQEQRGIVRLALERAVQLRQRAVAVAARIENQRQVVARFHVLGIAREQVAIRRRGPLHLATLARFPGGDIQRIIGDRRRCRCARRGGWWRCWGRWRFWRFPPL